MFRTEKRTNTGTDIYVTDNNDEYPRLIGFIRRSCGKYHADGGLLDLGWFDSFHTAKSAIEANFTR